MDCLGKEIRFADSAKVEWPRLVKKIVKTPTKYGYGELRFTSYILLHVLQLSFVLFVPASHPFSTHHARKTYLLLYVGGVSVPNLQTVSCGSVCILNSTLWLQMEFYPLHANKVRVPGSEGPNAAIKGLRSLLEKTWKFLNVPNQLLLDMAEVLNSYCYKKSLCFIKYKVIS